MTLSRQLPSGFSPSERSSVALQLAAEASSVRLAREAAAGLAEREGASPECVEDIRLAVSEAATNVVVHAYVRGGAQSFRLLAAIVDADMLVIIDDDGRGLSSPARKPGLGMGLSLMRQLADEVACFTHGDDGCTVEMRFGLNR